MVVMTAVILTRCCNLPFIVRSWFPFLSLSNYVIFGWGRWHFLTCSSLKALRDIDSSACAWTFSGEFSFPMRTDAVEFDGEFNPVPNGIEEEKDWERERGKEKRGGEEREKRDVGERTMCASVISFGGSFFKLLWDE